MCELLCVSSLLPTTVSITLERLARHGALGGANVDGWGVAAYDDRDIRLYKEPEPAGQSAWLAFILGRDLECSLMMSHIRRASQGPLTHANTQPFARELAGRMHVFAHNGDLRGLARLTRHGPQRFTPVGQTDSELAFCILLQRLESLWTDGEVPTLKARLKVVEAFAADIRLLGTANFLYADGDVIFAHGHRRPPYAAGHGQPGLWRLEEAHAVDPVVLSAHGVKIGPHKKGQEITLIASVPLTQGPWIAFDPGEIVVLKQGRLARRLEAAYPTDAVSGPVVLELK
jgi:glutamine amidotransferase